jgi:NADH-quinone oxidoreductase subunit H
VSVADAIAPGAAVLYEAVPPDWPGHPWWHWVVFSVIIIAFVLVMVIVSIYVERRGIAKLAARVGPNRTGPFGILQAMADGVKVLLKENITPAASDSIVFWLAPIVVFAPVIMVFSVVPFQNGAMLADLNIGVLFVVAIGSISTLGVFMAGWSSSNKYSLIGAMRMVAAVVSYEMPVVMTIAGVVMLAGSLSMNDIVLAQNVPFILLQPLGFAVLLIGGLAEINRSPFDLMEADSELTAGFHTEYSGMKFAMFYLGEYGEAVVLSAVIATLFLGGWKGPLLPPWLWFTLKVIFMFFIMVWIRSTMPRVRIDQLMSLAWKFLFPLAIINLLITGLQVLAGWPENLMWVMVVVNFAALGVLVLLWSRMFKLGRGRVEV